MKNKYNFFSRKNNGIFTADENGDMFIIQVTRNTYKCYIGNNVIAENVLYLKNAIAIYNNY